MSNIIYTEKIFFKDFLKEYIKEKMFLNYWWLLVGHEQIKVVTIFMVSHGQRP